MARPIEIEIVKHVPLEELNDIVSAYEREMRSFARAKRVYVRACFLRARYRGYTVEEAASIARVSIKTGYNIQKLWNDGGIAALEPKFSGGRPSRLTDGQKKEIRELLSVNPMSTKGIRMWISEEYGIDYSEKQVHVILKGMKMHHAKPYPRDYRRPDDAEEILKKTSEMLWMPPEQTL